jgi:hypothetical protein
LGSEAGLDMDRRADIQRVSKGSRMAVEPVNEQSPTGDFQHHARDYSGFVKLFKWGAIISFITAMVVMIIISN